MACNHQFVRQIMPTGEMLSTCTVCNYADPADFSFMSWNNDCRCGKPGNRVVNFEVHLCEVCFFRYTVMEAAGRTAEFWEAHNALPVLFSPGIGGWVSYNVKYSVSQPPDSTMRIRNIHAPESKI
jgi:hypothetical protein